MRVWFLAISLLAFGIAQAQTPGKYGYKQPLSSSQLNRDLGSKPDVDHGTMTNATIGGSLAAPDGSIIVRLGNAGSSPGNYQDRGIRQTGPSHIQAQTYGYGPLAETQGVYTNQTQQTIDDSCAVGGFGGNMTSRGYVGASDQVGVCRMFTSALPLAALSYPSAVTFSNDPAATQGQFSTASFGAPAIYTGQTVQATKMNFASPLSPSVVAALRAGMMVRADNKNTLYGWTGFVKAWDPAGAWVTVDAWVSLLVSGTTVYVGYSPLAYTPNPTGGTPATSTTVYININQTGYGENDILTMPAGQYCLFGFGCGLEGKELSLINNGKPFVRGGGACVQGAEASCPTDEYNWFSDSPRIYGHFVGAGGLYGISAGFATAGGAIDKSFIAGEGRYAAFLAAPFNGDPMGDGFMSQQTENNAFSSKHAGPGYVYKVDAATGTIQQGGQGVAVSTVRGTVARQNASNGIQTLTLDGADPGANGSNLAVAIPSGSSVSMVAQLQISNTGDGGRQLTYEIRCLWKHPNGGTATLVASSDVPMLPATPTSGYNQACATDAVNGYGSIVVTQITGSVANTIASFDATINPL